MVNPVNVSEVPDVVPLILPGDDVTVYWVIAAPPFDAGAVHETSASVLPPVADTPVGAPGKVAGVTALEAVDAEPVPTLLVAVTVNVYAVPLVSPVTVADVPAVVAVRLPGEDVTVY